MFEPTHVLIFENNGKTSVCYQLPLQTLPTIFYELTASRSISDRNDAFEGGVVHEPLASFLCITQSTITSHLLSTSSYPPRWKLSGIKKTASSCLKLRFPGSIFSKVLDHSKVLDAEYEITTLNARALLPTNDSNKASDTKPGQSEHDVLQALTCIVQRAGDGPVQIPDSMLASLLGNLISVHEQIRDLQAKSVQSHRELEALQVASGTTFPRFKKLPSELLRMVWRFALFTPCIIGVEMIHHWGFGDEAFVPVVDHSPLRSVNKESRALVLAS
ncbi:hypothetical protein WAI453_009534 [Rhynchosporium graminicola]